MIVTPELGAQLRQRREALKLTQRAVANAVGVSDAWVGRLERGEAEASKPVLVALFGELRIGEHLAVLLHSELIPVEGLRIEERQGVVGLLEPRGIWWSGAGMYRLLPHGLKKTSKGVKLPNGDVFPLHPDYQGAIQNGPLPDGCFFDSNGQFRMPGHQRALTPREELLQLAQRLPEEQVRTACRLLEALLADGNEQ